MRCSTFASLPILASLPVALLASCNVVFGIEEGELGQTSSTTTSSSTGGGGGSGGGGGGEAGAGGTVTTCPPWPTTPCEDGLLSDSDNCCHPGRSCQGGECVDGFCTPVLLDPGQDTDTLGIATANGRVYWSTGCNSRIRSRAIDGSGPAIAATDSACIPTIAIDDTDLFWIQYDGGELRRIPQSGAASSDLVAVVPDAGAAWGKLAIGSTHALWATESDVVGIWTVAKSSLNGTPFPLATSVALGQTVQQIIEPMGVAIDDAYLYFSDASDTGYVARRSIASAEAEQDIVADLVASAPYAKFIAVDDEYVYWVDDFGDVSRRHKDGTGFTESIAADQYDPQQVAVDDTYVYWTVYGESNPFTGQVVRADKGGGNVVALATEMRNPRAIAQDCTTIYWVNHNNGDVGEIYKVAK